LSRDRKLAEFYNLCPKIWRALSPKKIWGQKHAKLVQFRTTAKKLDELWSTNKKVIGVHADPPCRVV